MLEVQAGMAGKALLDNSRVLCKASRMIRRLKHTDGDSSQQGSQSSEISENAFIRFAENAKDVANELTDKRKNVVNVMGSFTNAVAKTILTESQIRDQREGPKTRFAKNIKNLRDGYQRRSSTMRSAKKDAPTGTKVTSKIKLAARVKRTDPLTNADKISKGEFREKGSDYKLIWLILRKVPFDFMEVNNAKARPKTDNEFNMSDLIDSAMKTMRCPYSKSWVTTRVIEYRNYITNKGDMDLPDFPERFKTISEAVWDDILDLVETNAFKVNQAKFLIQWGVNQTAQHWNQTNSIYVLG